MGRPVGEKSFAAMLRIAINEVLPDGRSKLRALADTVLNEAIGGNMQAVKEVADRLDGKPAQSVELEANVKGNITVVSGVPRPD